MSTTIAIVVVPVLAAIAASSLSTWIVRFDPLDFLDGLDATEREPVEDRRSERILRHRRSSSGIDEKLVCAEALECCMPGGGPVE